MYLKPYTLLYEILSSLVSCSIIPSWHTLYSYSRGTTWYHHLRLFHTSPYIGYSIWQKSNIGLMANQYDTVLFCLSIYTPKVFIHTPLSTSTKSIYIQHNSSSLLGCICTIPLESTMCNTSRVFNIDKVITHIFKTQSKAAWTTAHTYMCSIFCICTYM